MKKYTEKELEMRSLIELREIAVSAGVKLPAVYLKPDLIKAIILLQSGQKEPHMK